MPKLDEIKPSKGKVTKGICKAREELLKKMNSLECAGCNKLEMHLD